MNHAGVYITVFEMKNDIVLSVYKTFNCCALHETSSSINVLFTNERNDS